MSLNASQQPRRRLRLQISMKSLLIGVTLCCVAFGVLWNCINRSIAQKESVRLLEQNQGCWIRYDYQVYEDPVLNQLFSGQPSRIGRWLGTDFVHHVKRVWFLRKATDLTPLLNFKELDYLSFNAGIENKNEWPTVCRLSSLKRLRIDDDAYKQIETSVSSNSSAKESDLGPLLANLHQLRELKFLSLNCQGLKPALLQPIFGLPELEELHVHFYGLEFESNGSNSRSASPEVTFSQSPHVSKLHLIWPTYDSESLNDLFRAVPNLRQLCVHSSIAADEKPGLDVFDGLSQFSQLNEIYFFAVDVRKLPESFARIPLKRLGIGFCHLRDDGLKAMELMEQLEYLQLNHTAITDQGLETILKVSNLKELSIIDTRVTDPGLLRLAESKSLRIIHIRDTLVTKEGIDAFRKRNPACELVE